jgi:hypothetical protein
MAQLAWMRWPCDSPADDAADDAEAMADNFLEVGKYVLRGFSRDLAGF